MAFSNCTSLQKTTIAAASIGESVFFQCPNLQEITLLDSVTSIGWRAFSDCTKLQEITIPAASIGEFAFSNCTGLQEITLLDSVTSIGKAAFFQCTNLQEITIPDSVTNIEENAFLSCSGLANVYCWPTVPPTLGNSSVFGNIASDAKIYVPQASVDAYKAANNWSGYASMIVGYDF